ncbi:hypothetical protein Abr02nite_10310 [Paractinoplanes brasiliensis]|nr:hypothetical protein Abr02nite_10310 [Actinoplanes brasiliensis]
MTEPTATWQDFEEVWHHCHCRPGASRTKLCVMAIAIAIFFLLILAAAVTGHTVDTRDSADWKPSNEGFRRT